MWPDPSETPLERRVFNKHFDKLLETGNINSDILGYMDRYQQRAVNEVKKAYTRLKNKL